MRFAKLFKYDLHTNRYTLIGVYILFANDTGVRLFDRHQKCLITHVNRRHDLSLDSKLFPARLVFFNDHSFAIGWADRVTVCQIKENKKYSKKDERKFSQYTKFCFLGFRCFIFYTRYCIKKRHIVRRHKQQICGNSIFVGAARPLYFRNRLYTGGISTFRFGCTFIEWINRVARACTFFHV